MSKTKEIINDFLKKDHAHRSVVISEHYETIDGMIKALSKAGYSVTKETEAQRGYYFARHHLVVFSEIESLSADVINFKSGKSIKTKEVWDGDDTSKFMAAYVSWLDCQDEALKPKVMYRETLRPIVNNNVFDVGGSTSTADKKKSILQFIHDKVLENCEIAPYRGIDEAIIGRVCPDTNEGCNPVDCPRMSYVFNAIMEKGWEDAE